MTSVPIINLDYLRTIAEGDEDLEKTMIEMVLEELPKEFELLKEHYRDGNWLELFQTSHKMKSTLSFVGSEEMTAANKAIEASAKNRTNLEEVKSCIAILEQQMDKVLAALNAALSTS